MLYFIFLIKCVWELKYEIQSSAIYIALSSSHTTNQLPIQIVLIEASRSPWSLENSLKVAWSSVKSHEVCRSLVESREVSWSPTKSAEIFCKSEVCMIEVSWSLEVWSLLFSSCKKIKYSIWCSVKSSAIYKPKSIS